MSVCSGGWPWRRRARCRCRCAVSGGSGGWLWRRRARCRCAVSGGCGGLGVGVQCRVAGGGRGDGATSLAVLVPGWGLALRSQAVWAGGAGSWRVVTSARAAVPLQGFPRVSSGSVTRRRADRRRRHNHALSRLSAGARNPRRRRSASRLRFGLCRSWADHAECLTKPPPRSSKNVQRREKRRNWEAGRTEGPRMSSHLRAVSPRGGGGSGSARLGPDKLSTICTTRTLSPRRLNSVMVAGELSPPRGRNIAIELRGFFVKTGERHCATFEWGAQT